MYIIGFLDSYYNVCFSLHLKFSAVYVHMDHLTELCNNNIETISGAGAPTAGQP